MFIGKKRVFPQKTTQKGGLIVFSQLFLLATIIIGGYFFATIFNSIRYLKGK